jgi:hypothetical protein
LPVPSSTAGMNKEERLLQKLDEAEGYAARDTTSNQYEAFSRLADVCRALVEENARLKANRSTGWCN